MPDANILPKRIRRCEVTNLALTEEIAEIRCALRAVYETLLLICTRIPTPTTGADPFDVLMLPPWHTNPRTRNLLPPPLNLNLEREGCEKLRQRLAVLSREERLAIEASQRRVFEVWEKLKKYEADREARLNREREGPTI